MKPLTLYERLYLPSPGGPVRRWQTELMLTFVLTLIATMRAENAKGGAA